MIIKTDLENDRDNLNTQQEHEQREPPFLFPKLRETPRSGDSDKPEEYGRLDVPLTLPQLPMADKVPQPSISYTAKRFV